MAVYFAPQRRNHLVEGLTGMAMQFAGNQVDSWQKRRQAEEEGRLFKEGLASFNGAMGPQEGEGLLDTNARAMRDAAGGARNKLMSALGGVDPRVIRSMTDYATALYKGQFDNEDKLQFGDSVAGRIQPIDAKNDPVGATTNALIAQAHGLRPEGIMQFTQPNMQVDQVDLGDRKEMVSYDPRTGEVTTPYSQDVELSPDTEYKGGVTMRGQDIEQAIAELKAKVEMEKHGTPSANSRVPSYSTIYGPSGEVYAFNSKTGEVTDTGEKSYPRGGSAPPEAKPLTTEQRGRIMKMGSDALVGFSGTSEEMWNRLVQLSGGNREALELMMQGAFGSKELPKDSYNEKGDGKNPHYGRLPAAAAEFGKGGSVRKAGTGAGAQDGQSAQPVSAQPVPVAAVAGENPFAGMVTDKVYAAARAKGYSDDQILAELQKIGRPNKNTTVSKR